MKSGWIGTMVGVAAATVIGMTPRVADACGGCFVPPEENTQVTGHRMVLSVGKEQTTLYDQIEYSGDPAEFAWVLPIKGQVQIGISSDLLFNQLGFDTNVSVQPPPLDCPYYEPCPGDDAEFGASGTSGAGGAGGVDNGGVDVIAQEVVGPYETVQLSATDPAALNDWLTTNGYAIPADIQPIINAYLSDGFDFLAMKLVPGTGIDRMAPVRITTPGASPELPLRMVAAGTGARTTMTLWVMGEGRYEPMNFPSFQIGAADVTWDWDTYQSNYSELQLAAYEASQFTAWQVETAIDVYPDSFRAQILNVVDFTDESQHGYYATVEEDSYTIANADMDALFAGLDPSSVMVTRLRADLGRPALANDLTLQASADQSNLPRVLYPEQEVGTKPSCPPPPQCGGGMGEGTGIFGPPPVRYDDDQPWKPEVGSCAVSHEGDEDFVLASGTLLGFVLLLGRRRRRR